MSCFPKTCRQFGETLLARLALWVIPRLPRRWVLALAAFLGRTAYLVAGGTRRIGRANLDLAFGDRLSNREKNAILRESFRTFSRVLLDLFWFSRDASARIARYVVFDPTFDALLSGRPTVVATGHFGNWEILGQAAAFRGCPAVSVFAEMKNPSITDMLVRARERTGQKMVGRGGAVREALKQLRADGVAAFLLDQNTPPEEGGEFVPFFGRSVPISKAAAALAVKAGAEIVPAFGVPEAGGGYRVYARPPLTFDRMAPDAVSRGTRQIAAAMEEEVRRHPGQWLWTYKRWKHVPPGTPREGYPFYARERS
jgi:KDO2-lipid IV(A) lauroyltransferase